MSVEILLRCANREIPPVEESSTDCFIRIAVGTRAVFLLHLNKRANKNTPRGILAFCCYSRQSDSRQSASKLLL